MIFIVVFSFTLGILLEDSVIIYSNIVVASVVTDPVIIGIQTRKGLGVPVNHNEAFGWFFLSSNQGNVLANYALGHSYYKGLGVKQNYKWIDLLHIFLLLMMMME